MTLLCVNECCLVGSWLEVEVILMVSFLLLLDSNDAAEQIEYVEYD